MYFYFYFVTLKYKERLKLLTKYMIYYLQYFSLPLVMSKGDFFIFQTTNTYAYVCTYR